MSDWGATHNESASIAAGLDQKMAHALSPAAQLGVALLLGVCNSSSLELSHAKYTERVNDAVVRIATQMYSIGSLSFVIQRDKYALGLVDDPSAYGNVSADCRLSGHAQASRDIAAESIVLLKNDVGVGCALDKALLTKSREFFH